MKEFSPDKKDLELLEALRKGARKTVAELSGELGMPRATVHERIVRLRKKGLIKKFTIEQDYGKVGLPTLAFVFANYDRNARIDQHQLAKKLAKLTGVLGVYITSGEWDLILKVRGKSIEDIGMFIVDGIRRTPGIYKTRTIACFEVVKDEA